jgi:hypothetical protein
MQRSSAKTLEGGIPPLLQPMGWRQGKIRLNLKMDRKKGSLSRIDSFWKSLSLIFLHALHDFIFSNFRIRVDG